MIPVWEESKAMTQHDTVDTGAAYNKDMQEAVSSLKRKRLISRLWISFRLILIAVPLSAISILTSNELLKDIFINLTATFFAAAVLFFFLDDIWRRNHETYTVVMNTIDYVARITTLFDKLTAKTFEIKKQHSELKQLLDLVITQKYDYQLWSLEKIEERTHELNTELGNLNSKTDQYLNSLTTLLDNPPSQHPELIQIIRVSMKRLREVILLISHTIDENTQLVINSRDEFIRVNNEFVEQNTSLNPQKIEAMAQALQNYASIQHKFKDDMDKFQKKRNEIEKELD